MLETSSELVDLQHCPAWTSPPGDLGDFWEQTLAELRQVPLETRFEVMTYPVPDVAVYRVLFNGFRGSRIAGWYIAPRKPGRFPGLAIYHGYGGYREYVYDHLVWALQGFAVLAVDVAGQAGESTDSCRHGGGRVGGWLTQGILTREEYFYRGAYADSVRAVDVLLSRAEVEASRVGVTGISQGGGLALAVAALHRVPICVAADVPFLCDFPRALTLSPVAPYAELAEYLHIHPEHEEQVFETLRYFDLVNLAPWIQCPSLVSVGLRDQTCPPGTIYGMYNRITAPKEIRIWKYSGHDVWLSPQKEVRLEFLRHHLLENLEVEHS